MSFEGGEVVSRRGLGLQRRPVTEDEPTKRSGIFAIVPSLVKRGLLEPSFFIGSFGVRADDTPADGDVPTFNAADQEFDFRPGGGGSGAPTGASYVVIALDPTLTAERRLQVTSPLTLTDGGANGDVTIGGGHSQDHASRHAEGGADDLVGQNVNVRRLKIEDTDATPVDDAILKAADGVAQLRNSGDTAFAVLQLLRLALGSDASIKGDGTAVAAVRNALDTAYATLRANSLEANNYGPQSGAAFRALAAADILGIPIFAGDPAGVADGDIWYNSTAAKFRKRQAGVTEDLDTTGGGGGGNDAGQVTIIPGVLVLNRKTLEVPALVAFTCKKLDVRVGVAATSDLIFTFRQNGTSIGTVTVAANAKAPASATTVSVSIAQRDLLQVEITTAANPDGLDAVCEFIGG